MEARSRFRLVAFSLAVLASPQPLVAQDAPERPPVEEVLRALCEKHRDDERKYAALVAKVDKAVRKALEPHPYLELVAELSAAVPEKPPKSPHALARERLARHPWSDRLDLVEGLEYGSDRPIPAHENGFIALGDLPEPGPNLPAPEVNHYLFGLQEIVGWRANVVEKKQLAFRARPAKDAPPPAERELPPWEALRVYLRGSLPEVPLLAMPALTHRIHSRLAELRSADGKPAPMDELFALLDAHWNAFTFRTPFSKAPTAVAIPALTLIADRQGFVYRFPTGAHLGTTGDVPFVSDPTLRAYARAVRGEEIEILDFIADAPHAAAARDAFWRECVYLSRYRALVDLFVRALLDPGGRLPAVLADCDFPRGKAAAECSASELDVVRKHALVLWAHAGSDPRALAERLHREVLDLEVNRFPKNASLQSELAYYVRGRDAELLAAIAARETAPGTLAAELSPHAADAAADAPSTARIVQRYHASHAAVATAIRDAAYAVVLAELGRR